MVDTQSLESGSLTVISHITNYNMTWFYGRPHFISTTDPNSRLICSVRVTHPSTTNHSSDKFDLTNQITLLYLVGSA